MDYRTRFAHERLDAYRVALDLFRGVEEIVLDFPRGHADLKDQLRRATAASVRNIAEGSNRAHPRDKAARFITARGECGEAAASLEMAEIAGIVAVDRSRDLRQLADRIAAMLTGLIRCERSRAPS